ncbi:MAG: DUF3822 family protein [Lewinellaceae bacterium]|nr:DUF3822 family protein [Lewinellaceae bacterium]
MDKHSLDLKDSRLTADTAPESALYAVLGTESVTMLAANASGEVLALESWEYAGAGKPFAQIEREVRQMLQEAAVWGLPYGEKHGFLFHPNTTLVPRRLFQHGDLSDYFHLLLPPGAYDYAYEELPEFDAYLVLATEKSQADLFATLFPQTRQRHLAAPLLRHVRERAGIAEHTVFLNLRHQMAQIIVLERQNLLFYNTFRFTTATDLLYYVLLAYDQFRLSPEEAPLTVAGNILRDSELYRALFRFVREVRFAVPPGHFRLPPETEVLPQHCYLDLFCLKKN